MTAESASKPHARRIRVIPTLLIDGRGRLVKSVKFAKRTYIGDPINAVKIFNTKEVDELMLLDIDATREARAPNYGLIEDIVSEAFMPVSYGGGIGSMAEIARLFKCGIEKVVLSSAIDNGTPLIEEGAARFGAQAIVVCLPVKKGLFGVYAVRLRAGKHGLRGTPHDIARRVAARGAGEIVIYCIDRDGTFAGYDIDLLRGIAGAVDVPVVACGGASSLDDFRAAVAEAGCSAVAAGSLFVYRTERRGVLISYPTQQQLAASLFDRVT